MRLSTDIFLPLGKCRAVLVAEFWNNPIGENLGFLHHWDPSCDLLANCSEIQPKPIHKIAEI